MIATDPHPADERLSAFAVALGRRHLGLTWPNPSVGAAVVSPDGVVLATGITQSGGRPHAEPVALACAGGAARGATLYVSLEPCSHHGRTPPCVDAIVAAGLARVVAPIPDPDARVAGRGFALLREAGIAVTVGPQAGAAARAHRGHLMRVRAGRPFVTVKLARTADGFAAACGPERLLITGEAAGRVTHRARADADAILTGIGTVRADDPRLDVRLPGLEGRRPVRVVLDTHLALDPASRLVSGAARRPTWVLCREGAAPDAAARLRDRGVEVMPMPPGADGRIDLPAALRHLGARGLTQVWCEGGPALADALAAADLVDECVLMTSPDALGAPGLPALGPHLAAALGAALRAAGTLEAGRDTIAVFERATPCSPAS